jgi:protein-L-isoaspartate(D-aspartate) O-methyltransferase
LELKGNEKILEVGTGSGYQAAVLAELACDVITTERIPALAESARKALNCLGYTRVKIFPAADKLGWEPEAPYDGIVVTAGAPRVPASLLNQLTVGGKLVIPVGERDIQRLLKITKLDTGNRVQDLGSCRFVPLIGAEAWEA